MLVLTYTFSLIDLYLVMLIDYVFRRPNILFVLFADRVMYD